jgi:hypothetical protein
MNKRDAIVFFGALLGGKFPAWNIEIKNLGLAILDIEEPGERTDRLNNLKNLNAEHPNILIDEMATLASDDFARLAELLSKWQQSFNIKGVICNREQHVVLAAFATEFTGCRGPGMFASLISRDKVKQRRLLSDFGPKYEVIFASDAIERVSHLTFPLVFKPADGSGSIGVKRINSYDEAQEYLKSNGNTDVFLAEALVEGREFSVESIIKDGVIQFVGIVEKCTNEKTSNFFVETGHRLPALQITPLESRHLMDVNQKILKRLQFDTGISHAEFRIDLSGNIVLMEIAVRPPGDAIIELYSRVYEFNFVCEFIKLMKNEIFNFPTAPIKFASQIYLEMKYGKFFRVSHSDPMVAVKYHRAGDVASWPYSPNPEIFVELPIGAILSPTQSSVGRIGSFVVEASNAEELMVNERSFYASCSVELA